MLKKAAVSLNAGASRCIFMSTAICQCHATAPAGPLFRAPVCQRSYNNSGLFQHTLPDIWTEAGVYHQSDFSVLVRFSGQHQSDF